MPYANFANVQSLGFELDATEQTKFDSLLLPAASRLIDRACEVADGFFEAAAAVAEDDEDEGRTAQIFYGDGSDMLAVAPFVAGSVDEVALPEGYEELTADDFYAVPDLRSFYLVRGYGSTRLPLTDAWAWAYNGLLPTFPVGPFDLVTNNFRSLARGAGWPRGVAVTVTARWGWAVVPAEVRAATVETAIKLWRGLDPAAEKVSDIEKRTPTALDPVAQLLADKYRERRAPVFA